MIEPLESPRKRAYTVPVTAQSVTRRGNRHLKRRAAPDRRFFCGRSPLNGGLCRATARLAGILLGRFPLPASARHSRRGKRSGGFQPKRNLS